jgi:hypothetical protein
MKMRREEGHNLRILGEIVLTDRRTAQAGTYFQDSLTILNEVGDEYESAQTRLSLANLHALEGQPESARADLELSEAVFTRLEAALDLQKIAQLRTKLDLA